MKPETKTTIKKAGRMTLCVSPLLIIAGVSVAWYSLGTGMIAGTGMPTQTIVLLVMAQTLCYGLFASFFGYQLSDAVGLLKPFAFKQRPLVKSLLYGLVGGVIFFVVDYLWFARAIPGVGDYYRSYPFSLSYLAAEVVYGGIVEELLMRFLLLSLVVFVVWKLFMRKRSKAELPLWLFTVANAVVALLFAAGHLPATVALYGTLTPLILLRCFLINGGLGYLFGVLYLKDGIQYAMVAHALVHLVCDLLLRIVI